ncbi:MAG: alpha/beta hydrolase [Burkholderiales bacterium]|nr:alpha/beta hydrolase [Burkholderiales bacterium]
MDLFPGFRRELVRANGIDIHAVIGPKREGPALLLLHGYPQTHAIWHKVAPRLAEKFNVVAADLRGYGDSAKPPAAPGHESYSKRVMARDQAELMSALGHERFLLVGHDRGGRVAHRLAVDHPARVAKLVVLDIAPTLAMYEQTTEVFARAYWHWFFLILPAHVPETMIGTDPRQYLRHKMGESLALGVFAKEAWAEYERCFTPGAIHASCEDYRAAATIDLVQDRADRDAGRGIQCPLLVLWGARGIIERCFRPIEEWKRVAADVRGRALAAGHYLPEEIPDMLVEELEAFFGGA